MLLGGSASSGAPATGDSLGDEVAAAERVGEQVTDVLARASSALSSMHKMVLPNSELLSTLGELVEVFNSNTSAVEAYGHRQTVCGSQTTLVLLLGHGVDGNFEKAVSCFLKGPDGKAILLQPHLAWSEELAKTLTATLEKCVAEQAAKAKAKKPSSTS